jgi:hypothetical protein
MRCACWSCRAGRGCRGRCRGQFTFCRRRASRPEGLRGRQKANSPLRQLSLAPTALHRRDFCHIVTRLSRAQALRGKGLSEFCDSVTGICENPALAALRRVGTEPNRICNDKEQDRRCARGTPPDRRGQVHIERSGGFSNCEEAVGASLRDQPKHQNEVVILDLFGKRSAVSGIRSETLELPEPRQKIKAGCRPIRMVLSCSRSSCVAADLSQVPEWIPDTRRFASLAGEVENDDSQ